MFLYNNSSTKSYENYIEIIIESVYKTKLVIFGINLLYFGITQVFYWQMFI